MNNNEKKFYPKSSLFWGIGLLLIFSVFYVIIRFSGSTENIVLSNVIIIIGISIALLLIALSSSTRFYIRNNRIEHNFMVVIYNNGVKRYGFGKQQILYTDITHILFSKLKAKGTVSIYPLSFYLKNDDIIHFQLQAFTKKQINIIVNELKLITPDFRTLTSDMK